MHPLLKRILDPSLRGLHFALSDAISKHKLSIEYKAADRTAPEKTKRCVHRARCPFTCPNPKVGTLKNGVITLVFSEYGRRAQSVNAALNFEQLKIKGNESNNNNNNN